MQTQVKTIQQNTNRNSKKQQTSPNHEHNNNTNAAIEANKKNIVNNTPKTTMITKTIPRL